MRHRRLSTVQGLYILAAALPLVLVPGSAGAQHHISRGGSHAAPMGSAMLATQVALDRAGFSPGEIDGQGGRKTTLALAAFRASSKAPLDIPSEPLTTYTITEQDAAGPFIESVPTDMMEEAKLPALSYASALEGLAEKFHSSPSLLRRLNPRASWAAGDSIKVPDVQPFELPHGPGEKAAMGLEVIVSSETKSLVLHDSTGRTLMYAPVTTGSEHDPLPVGEWKVVSVTWNPAFNYNPDLFWDADATQTKAKIPAGPNNPVGIVWIDINKAHFGLHGTPEPSTVGRTESHGCIRLTNWDAARLGRLVGPGTKVILQ